MRKTKLNRCRWFSEELKTSEIKKTQWEKGESKFKEVWTYLRLWNENCWSNTVIGTRETFEFEVFKNSAWENALRLLYESDCMKEKSSIYGLPMDNMTKLLVWKEETEWGVKELEKHMGWKRVDELTDESVLRWYRRGENGEENDGLTMRECVKKG